MMAGKKSSTETQGKSTQMAGPGACGKAVAGPMKLSGRKGLVIRTLRQLQKQEEIMSKKLLLMAVGTAALFAASPAFAQSVAPVTISSFLQVQDGCLINGGNNQSILNFGIVQNASALTSGLRATTSQGGAPIIVSCNVSSTTAAFQIDTGNNDSGGIHRLRNITGVGGAPGEFLEYHVYASPALTTASEYLIGSPRQVNGGVITAGVPFEVVIYGEIPNTQVTQGVAGFYQDILQAQLTF